MRSSTLDRLARAFEIQARVIARTGGLSYAAGGDAEDHLVAAVEFLAEQAAKDCPEAVRQTDEARAVAAAVAAAVGTVAAPPPPALPAEVAVLSPTAEVAGGRWLDAEQPSLPIPELPPPPPPPPLPAPTPTRRRRAV